MNSAMKGPVSMERESPNQVTTRLIDGGIVETVYVGRITPEMAAKVRRELEPLLRARKGTHWLLDATRATSIGSAPREDTTGVIEMFKTLNGGRIAAVIPSSPVRMMVSALVFAMGLPLKMFESRTLAIAYLKEN